MCHSASHHEQSRPGRWYAWLARLLSELREAVHALLRVRSLPALFRNEIRLPQVHLFALDPHHMSDENFFESFWCGASTFTAFSALCGFPDVIRTDNMSVFRADNALLIFLRRMGETARDHRSSINRPRPFRGIQDCEICSLLHC
jgi:hypothetical protein